MIKVTGIKLKVLFALHLFCAMFALLAWPNTVSIESIIHLFSDAMLFMLISRVTSSPMSCSTSVSSGLLLSPAWLIL